MSLLTQLSLVTKLFLHEGLPENLRARISRVLNGYLLTSNLADRCETPAPIFAFEENSSLDELCAAPGFVLENMRNALGQLIQRRRSLTRAEQLSLRLDRFQELPFEEQHVTLLVLNSVMHATPRCDEIVETWLNETK